TSVQLRQDAGNMMLQTAREMADRLSREMASRVREVQLLSRIELFRDATETDAMRAELERLRASLPAYAWIGVTDAEGKVIGAAEKRDALLKPRGAHSSLQLMVYGADGGLLLGPQAGGTPTLPTATLAALEERWNIEQWSDGVEAISASAESRSSGEFQGFGWR